MATAVVFATFWLIFKPLARLLFASIFAKALRHQGCGKEEFFHSGGFPEPYLKGTKRFYTRWNQLRNRVLVHKEIRDMTRIQDLAQLELLTKILTEQAGKRISYYSLAKMVRVSSLTIQRWIETLEAMYYCFSIRPWRRNIVRSLIKEPKLYLWDWARVKDVGARNENFIASHLLKAAHYWTDVGHEEFDLYYIRDKFKREIDFLVTKGDKPWFLVEVKTSGNNNITPALRHFQEKTQALHAFQVAFDEAFVYKDCFSVTEPVIVPATTFLSQLV